MEMSRLLISFLLLTLLFNNDIVYSFHLNNNHHHRKSFSNNPKLTNIQSKTISTSKLNMINVDDATTSYLSSATISLLINNFFFDKSNSKSEFFFFFFSGSGALGIGLYIYLYLYILSCLYIDVFILLVYKIKRLRCIDESDIS